MPKKIGLITTLMVNREPFDARKYRYEPYVPLGLLSMGAILESHGYKVVLIDINLELKRRNIPYVGNKNFYYEAAALIKEKGVDALGFTTLCDSLFHTIKFAEQYKKISPSVPIALGGPQASMMDIEILKAFPYVDAIARGETENTCVGFFDALLSHRSFSAVYGVSYREDGLVKRTPEQPFLQNLDLLPMPAYHLLDEQIRQNEFIHLEAGRGCPFACKFCSTSEYWQRRYRLKSVERLLIEIKFLRKHLHVKRVKLVHDLFTLQRKHLTEFCNRLIKEKMDIFWSCSARIDTVDKPLLDLMAKSNCIGIFYGIETGSKRMQKIVGKNLNLTDINKKVMWSIQNNIATTASFIVGYPEEKMNDFQATLDLLLTLNVQGAITLLGTLLVMPGSFYTQKEKKFRIDRFSLFYGFLGDRRSSYLSLIRKYPLLFPSFFYFHTPRIPRDLLNGLNRFCLFSIPVFHFSIYAIIRNTKVSDIVSLYKKWIVWRDRHGLSAFWISNSKFYEFLREIILRFGGAKRDALLELLYCENNFAFRFRKEAKRWWESGVKAEELPLRYDPLYTTQEMLRLYPEMNRFFKIRTFNYDILKMIAGLRAGQGFRMIRSNTRILFYQPESFSGEILVARLKEPIEFIVKNIIKEKLTVSGLLTMVAERYPEPGVPARETRLTYERLIRNLWATGVIQMRK